jgi:outer membrane protein assembly factor BamB
MRDKDVASRAGRARGTAFTVLAVLAAALFLAPAFVWPGERKGAAAQADAAVPPQAEPPQQTEAEEARSREQRMLRQVIFRDRDVQSTVEQAETAFRSGKASQGLELIQQVLDQRCDHFVWLERERRLTSARHRASGLLSSADGKTRSLYEWAYAREARRLLDAGKSCGDPTLIADVSRRYFHTTAGFEATDWMATHWLDRGEYALAVRAWAQLAADSQHSVRMTDAMRRKSAVAEQLLARSSSPSPWSLARSADVRTADVNAADDRGGEGEQGNSSSITRVAAFEPAQPESPVRSALPYMKPVWRKSLASGKEPIIDGAVRRWEIGIKHEDKQPVAVHSAVVAGSTIAFRSYDGITAVDATTGQTVWSYTAGTSFLRAWSDVVQSGVLNGDGTPAGDGALDALMNAYAGNSVLGTLTTDGRRVFGIDSMDLHPHSSVPAAEEPGEPHDGSPRMPRSANRLIALDLFSPENDEAGGVKPVWAVGGSIGSAHWFYRMDANDDGRVTQSEFLGSAEDFRKLDRNNDGAIDLAESKNPEVKLERHPLHGHFFLGPPLALDGRLYAVTECDSRLNLVALRADTGAVLWVQGISYVDRPIDEDLLRNTLACTPCYSAGVIVCPTQMGVLVGVDALDGALLWTYYYGDDDTASESAWSFMSHRPYGNTGFANPPLIEGNRIVLLPRQSDSIHCIDLTTGNKLWKQPRNDAEFIAGAAEGVVMAVGERISYGLSLVDGTSRWSTRTGAISGSGLRAGTQYLLPLAENRVVAIDMRSGARTGSSAPEEGERKAEESDNSRDAAQARADETAASDSGHEESTELRTFDMMVRMARLFERRAEAAFVGQPTFPDKPGNLVGGGPFIVSVGPREIVAYPRAVALLSEVKDRLAGSERAANDLLLAADLERMLDGGAAAKDYLAQLREGGPPEIAERRSRLLRAVLYQELAAGKGESTGILNELDKLSRTPEERGRFLQSQAAADLRRKEFVEAIDSATAFARLDLPGLVPSPTDPTHLMSARSWLSSQSSELASALSRIGPRPMCGVNARAADEQQAALKSGDSKALERFLAVHPRHGYADAVRLRLADVLTRAGQVQRAELLLIQSRRSSSRETREAAALQLAHLWDRSGMSEEAAELLAEQAHPRLDDFPADSLARLAYQRLQEAATPVRRVRISQTFLEHCDRDLDDAYTNASRPFVTRPTSPFQLIDRSSSSTPAEISIIDRLSGSIIDTLRIPAPYTGSVVASASQVGHFLPLGSRGALHGVSLLERDRQKPLWTTSPPQIAYDVDPVLVGPSGPTFCVYQSHGNLFVVDPGTGHILWQRTDLDPQSGLGGDPIRGIFGDEQVLVVLAPDHLAYTLYNTSTGEEIRQGRLDNESRQTSDRRPFGRCLMYLTAEETSRRLRIWDPLGDRLLYDRAISDRVLVKETADDEVAVVCEDYTLQIIDGKTGAVRASQALTQREVQNACQLAFFRDAARYYVNLQPVQSPPEPRFYNYFFGTDTVLPRVDVRGDVMAIDRKTGRLLWKQCFQQRTILRTPSMQLPVLVMLSSVGDRMNGNHRSMLVEVVDIGTGETLGVENNKFPNRILELTYEHDRHRVRLWGTRSVIDLDLVTSAASSLAGVSRN